MSNEQWVQGMLLCILEESSVENKNYMLSYFSMMMQDAIELSLGTAPKAHAVVLQEMEKGKFTWNDFDLVEKCKNRHTQRMLQTVKGTTTSNTQVCVFYNKGKCKNDSDHVSSGILYQHCCSYCYKETKKRYEHPANQCMRMRNGTSKTETGTQRLTNSMFNKIYTNLSMAIENNSLLDNISQFANDKSILLEGIYNQESCDIDINMNVEKPVKWLSNSWVFHNNHQINWVNN